MPEGVRAASPPDGPVVLVTSPHSRRSARGLPLAREALRRLGVQVVEEVPIDRVSHVPELIGDGGARMVVAAGGDGTVGAAADAVADTPVVLGVLPLGTSNDFARSLGIPMRVDRAAALLRSGKVSTIDLGRLEAAGREPLHFVHAATAGLNVSFAKLATRASLRKRLGRFTYAAAAALALRDNRPFECEVTCEGRTERWRLTHLSVINAPVFGGFLGMRVSGSSPDDRLLDVLAVEEIPARRVILAALHQLFHVARPVPGVHALHVSEMRVRTELPLDVALDGEVRGTLPADFVVAGEALRVVTPLDFADVDD